MCCGGVALTKDTVTVNIFDERMDRVLLSPFVNTGGFLLAFAFQTGIEGGRS